MRRLILVSAILLTTQMIFGQTQNFSNPTLKVEEVEKPVGVTGYTASNDGKYRMEKVRIPFESDAGAAVDGTFRLSVNSHLQDIDGFGFAITGSAAYNLTKMNEAERKALLNKIFSRRNGFGCSFVRIPIGCSDFSLSEYTCCDTPGIENFGLTEEETRYIIPIMKEILAINPTVKVISAPWTAPRWMKTNGKWTSGNLKPECYEDYATYFVKWIKAFENEGIKIYGVTPQNEPLNHGNSASMYMSWQEQRDFIKNALGPAFKNNDISTKIYVFDHNYNYDNIADQQQYPAKIYADPDASKYIAGAAYHNYGGHALEMSNIHQQYPEKELTFTEWTAGTWSWPGVGMEAITTDAQSLIFDVLQNWGRGAVVWNLMLDSDRGPNRPGGCVTGNGAVDISKANYKDLTYNSFYYVICVAASATSDEARLIPTTGSARDVQIVAFDNMDGYGAVLMNTSNSTKKIRIEERTNKFVATLPPYSISSFKW